MEKFHKSWKNVAIRKWIYDKLEQLSAKEGRSLSNFLEFHLIRYLKLKEESSHE